MHSARAGAFSIRSGRQADELSALGSDCFCDLSHTMGSIGFDFDSFYLCQPCSHAFFELAR